MSHPRRVQLLRRQPITVVMYHAISDDSDPYAIAPSAFRRQIAWLKNHFAILRLGDVSAELNRENRGERGIIITFDDAFQDFQDAAFPILAEYGVPSTVFVPTGFIGGFNEWDAPHDVCPRRRIMTDDSLRTLQSTGLVDFGSHTVDHRSMSHLSPGDMYAQARESRLALEGILGRSVTMFAYPYGTRSDFSAETTNALSLAGYQAAVTTCWGTTNSADDLLTLRRITFGNADSPATLSAKVRGLYDWIALKERLGYSLRRFRTRLRGSVSVNGGVEG